MQDEIGQFIWFDLAKVRKEIQGGASGGPQAAVRNFVKLSMLQGNDYLPKVVSIVLRSSFRLSHALAQLRGFDLKEHWRVCCKQQKLTDPKSHAEDSDVDWTLPDNVGAVRGYYPWSRKFSF